MGTSRGVEAQGAADRLDHRGGGRDAPPLFQPGVVVGGHAGQQRDLLAPQTRHAAHAPVGRQPGPFGVDLATGPSQEIREFAVDTSHASIVADPGRS